MSSKSVAPHKHPKTRSPTEAWVAEPDLNDCNPNARWRIRLIRSQMTAKFEIEIRFRTRDKQLELLLIDNGRWSEFDFIRKELESRNVRLPNDRHDALDFVRELTRKTPLRPKFAIFYAAGQVGVQSGLLPWPVDWPMRVVRHCYENSLNERDPDVAATNKAVWLLAKSLN
jgi:hypothetical protein